MDASLSKRRAIGSVSFVSGNSGNVVINTQNLVVLNITGEVDYLNIEKQLVFIKIIPQSKVRMGTEAPIPGNSY